MREITFRRDGRFVLTAAAQFPPDDGLFLRTIEVTDASGQSIDDLRITSESGFDYDAFIDEEHGQFLKFTGGYRGVLQKKTGDEISPMADRIFASRITGGSVSIAFTFRGENLRRWERIAESDGRVWRTF